MGDLPPGLGAQAHPLTFVPGNRDGVPLHYWVMTSFQIKLLALIHKHNGEQWDIIDLGMLVH